VEKVLLVDDEVEICVLLSGILQREGFRTDYALSLKDAKDRLSSESFNVVFIDLNLPDGLGSQLIPVIRREMKNTKIIIVSAYDSEMKKVFDLGADYFITKPFNKTKILEALKKIEV
jgi:DNA-binding response OmpR family regulator